MSIFKTMKRLESDKIIHPQSWLIENTHYVVIMGSYAYGVSQDDSDMDVYGWCIPPKSYIFPHQVNGEIEGFGKQHARFNQWQDHHVNDTAHNKEYDFTIYSIVRYFQLCMEGNPNMIDSLFVPVRCRLFCSSIANHLLDNRKLFLHKGCYHKLKGYAFSQLSKLDRDFIGKRKEEADQHGYSLKFAYHLVRLLSECEQILTDYDLVLDEKGRREHMKSVRRGDYTKQQIIEYFQDKEKQLEKLYHESKIPHKPNEEKIKKVLLECLEMHYGNIDNLVKKETSQQDLLTDLKKLVKEYDH